MASSCDVREILDINDANSGKPTITKEAIIAKTEKKRPKKTDVPIKRPEGMARELWGLLSGDHTSLPPIIPSDSGKISGYKEARAKLGLARVRPWKWTAFVNPARSDNAELYHWRRIVDENQEYPFAKFSKTVDVPSYTDEEYEQWLRNEKWSKEASDTLMEYARRFDLRFVIMEDRWDAEKYEKRSVEDLKERYYQICYVLNKQRPTNHPSRSEPPFDSGNSFAFDADHERRRKRQLCLLYDRTPEQVEEEERLISELKKIEQRKKERERKTQDLQKLISQVDAASLQREQAGLGPGGAGGAGGTGGASEGRKSADRKATNASGAAMKKKHGSEMMFDGLKFGELRNPGVHLRSQKMKFAGNIGQRKTRVIEAFLQEMQIDPNPPPTEEIIQCFNDLRTDIVVWNELKTAWQSLESELQTLKLKYEQLSPGKPLPAILASDPCDPELGLTVALSGRLSETTSSIPPGGLLPNSGGLMAPGMGGPRFHATRSAGAIPQGSGGNLGSPNTPVRKKRAAAIEQAAVLKRLKHRGGPSD